MTVPYPGYDKLGDREVVAGLHEHSQVELTAVDAYERSHRDRKPVLDKLRFLRRREPLSGYDDLKVAQILTIVDDADLQSLDRIRSYERKFANRPAIIDRIVALHGTLRAAQPKQAVPAYQPASARKR